MKNITRKDIIQPLGNKTIFYNSAKETADLSLSKLANKHFKLAEKLEEQFAVPYLKVNNIFTREITLKKNCAAQKR